MEVYVTTDLVNRDGKSVRLQYRRKSQSLRHCLDQAYELIHYSEYFKGAKHLNTNVSNSACHSDGRNFIPRYSADCPELATCKVVGLKRNMRGTVQVQEGSDDKFLLCFWSLTSP